MPLSVGCILAEPGAARKDEFDLVLYFLEQHLESGEHVGGFVLVHVGEMPFVCK